jgi:hypothetical protein
VVSTAYVSAGDAPTYDPAHLLPVWIYGSGKIWDAETPAVQLRIGQRVSIKEPIIVDGGMIFLIITERRKSTSSAKK